VTPGDLISTKGSGPAEATIEVIGFFWNLKRHAHAAISGDTPGILLAVSPDIVLVTNNYQFHAAYTLYPHKVGWSIVRHGELIA
jgi:hypothetical protein